MIDNKLNFDEAWIEAHSDWPDGNPMSISDIRRTKIYIRLAFDQPLDEVTKYFKEVVV